MAAWSTLIHDLTDGFLGAIGVIDMKAYELALNSPTVWRNLLWTLFAIYFTVLLPFPSLALPSLILLLRFILSSSPKASVQLRSSQAAARSLSA